MAMRGKVVFALLWNAITWFAVWLVFREPLPGDQWFLILVGLMILVGLALALDVVVRFFRVVRASGASPSPKGAPEARTTPPD